MSKISHNFITLGIDIGSVSLSYAALDAERRVVRSEYIIHHGNIIPCLRATLDGLQDLDIDRIGFNRKAAEFFCRGTVVNDQIALVEGIKATCRDARSVFSIGGETFGLVLFNRRGQYQKFLSNSSCAAGTGSFLDQQAERLGLSGSSELSEMALRYSKDPPKIATRCAVFAKTDLIHCQQQGFSLEAICAGLCRGLALNIADALTTGIELRNPIAVVGGVSRNKKVLSYLSDITGFPIEVPGSALLTPATGCAMIAAKQQKLTALKTEKIINTSTSSKHYFFAPLELKRSAYPDFTAHHRYVKQGVEIDLYKKPRSGRKLPVYIGIDVGSTSTKAVLMHVHKKEKNVIAGFYTRTLGQPVEATKSILKQIHALEKKYDIRFHIIGSGTTGSGRKFLQKILKTNYAIDEITAHARAAYELRPDTDTIIEIGGQDSKFTVMQNGRVTFSVMNYVCAAGTGSFIEEQARRLEVKLEDYASLAMHQPSPLSSDRCTVFMERDLNHLLSRGYSKAELLATTLHSVRDNYLARVAQLTRIGKVVCFQGATAKNAALVSAFEQKLQRPIFVSKYCHLTGALGVCFYLKDQKVHSTAFAGLNFYKQKLVAEEVVCEDCHNNCKINIIHCGEETIGWGYLCGRDEAGNTARSLSKQKFDLLRTRRRIFQPTDLPGDKQQERYHKTTQAQTAFDMDRLRENLGINLLSLRHRIFTFTHDESAVRQSKYKIGLPDTLYMQEYFPFWHYFLKKLGFSVIRGPASRSFVSRGKVLSAAEFCAPISAWHGNISYLSNYSDFIFTPQMFEEENTDSNRKYCYYSSYAIPIVSNLPSSRQVSRLVAPVIDFSKSAIHNIHAIFESFPQQLRLACAPSEIQDAYHEAWQWFTAQKALQVDLFKKLYREKNDIQVVLLGRPYLVLDPELSKMVPQLLNEAGITTHFQDMLPLSAEIPYRAGAEYLEWNHWKYGMEILQAAEYIGQHRGLYAVFLTAFKCSPDSFLLHYFREIMQDYDCPYLILQIDDHSSEVGYETRIEAAVETFRNHYKHKPQVRFREQQNRIHLLPYHPEAVLIPDYDTLSCNLICAAFEKAGYRSYLLEESDTSITKSLRINDGQCLPISAIVQAAYETVNRHELNPAKTALFLNTITNLACNFPQYPIMAKKLCEDIGNGFEKLQIFASDFEMKEFPLEVISDVYTGYLLGGLLRKIACRIRPLEQKAGMTNRIVEQGLESLYRTTVTKLPREEKFRDIVRALSSIPLYPKNDRRPKVSIIGDLYVRDNDVFNQQLIRELEAFGAEVVTTPFTYILRILAYKHKNILKEGGHYISLVKFGLLIEYLEKIERRYYKIAEPLLSEPFPNFNEAHFDRLRRYGITFDHGGETAQNFLKIFALLEHYPDLSLFIHVNPIFCCPGLVSESIFKTLEEDIGIPIISITYDGTSTRHNDILAPYIHYLKQAMAS